MSKYHVNCSQLLIGQYTCPPIQIDPVTQQPFGCTKENVAPLNCTINIGLACLPSTGFNETLFQSYTECQYTNGYSFETALLLSIFLGMFGADRFYLGYYALGLFKFCTFGFMLLGQLVDVILIATQVLLPADGSSYIIDYFGPKMTILSRDSPTNTLHVDMR